MSNQSNSLSPEPPVYTNPLLRLKDPGSAMTHLIGMVAALFGAIPLLLRAAAQPGWLHLVTLGVFILSMVLLYGASTVYHSFDVSERTNKLLRKIDHMMIFVLIAGTYTPICLIVLGGTAGTVMCALVWGVAVVGMLIKAFWITCPKWFSSVIYIGMGWICVAAFTQIYRALPFAAFMWLLAGGIIYTIGGVLYAIKFPLFNEKHRYFGSHEIFHLFVMGGSLCHFILMYVYVAGMAV